MEIYIAVIAVSQPIVVDNHLVDRASSMLITCTVCSLFRLLWSDENSACKLYSFWDWSSRLVCLSTNKTNKTNAHFRSSFCMTFWQLVFARGVVGLGVAAMWFMVSVIFNGESAPL